MIGPSLSIIALATGPDRLVARTLAEAARCSRDAELIVVHDRADASRLRPLMSGDTESLIASYADGRCMSPGDAMNAGVRASRGRGFVIVDGGHILGQHYLARACEALEHNAAFALALPDALPGNGTSVGLAELVGGPWVLPGCAVLARAALEAVGGFDPSLPTLVEWDLLLTLAARGYAGTAVDGGGVRRVDADDVRLRESLRPERHLPAVRQIVRKHRANFEAHMTRALVDRDRAGKKIWREGQAAGERHARVAAELAGTDAELDDVREQLRRLGLPALDWNELRRTTPLSRAWASDRGRPVDRFYIERFIERHASDIRGRVLEMLDPDLATRFGGPAVDRVDVLDIDPGNHRATVVADLRDAAVIETGTYDCVILTQTLHLIDDIQAAIRTAYRVLAPGGVLLATLPTASMIAEEYGQAGDHWRVTAAGARRLFEERFPSHMLEIRAHGNVLAMTASLYGLACEDVAAEELDCEDSAYPLIVTVRAVKPPVEAPAIGSAVPPVSAILLYHRVASLAHDHHGLAVSPEVFRSHVAHLARHWRLVSLTSLAHAMAAGDPPDRAVVLSFDDGYLDNLEMVVPILGEFGAPATFFLTSEAIDRPREYWWDALERCVLVEPSLPSVVALRLNGTPERYDAATPDARSRLHDALYARLRTAGPAVRDDVVRQLNTLTGQHGRSISNRPMTEGEIHELAARPGVEIGAHGVHHLAVSALDPEGLHREIFECRTTLERVTGCPVRHFAYPFGDVSAEAVATTREADYTAAVTCEPRAVRAHDWLHRLPRLSAPRLEGDAFAEWLCRACALPAWDRTERP